MIQATQEGQIFDETVNFIYDNSSESIDAGIDYVTESPFLVGGRIFIGVATSNIDGFICNGCCRGLT